MSIKVVLLQSNDQVITEIKELVSGENPVGYLFTNPHKVVTSKPFLSTEEDVRDRSLEVTLSPWIILSSEKEIAVPNNYVVTVVDPIDSIKKMYLEKVNGSNGSDNQVSSSEE